MPVEHHYLPYNKTRAFSVIVNHYLDGVASLQPFYQYAPNLNGLKQALQNRSFSNGDRQLLSSSLLQQYSALGLSNQNVLDNIQLLQQQQTFTVTTAHQPNLFTGPLYFIYKIVHAIVLAKELASQFPGYNFVPVYYMGSEDADLDELGVATIMGEAYRWNTLQQGAVGRMKVDKQLLQLIDRMHGQLAVLPYGSELIKLFKQCYVLGDVIQDCTTRLVDSLFGDYGLVVLNPDDAALKGRFVSVVEKELKEQFSHKLVQQTISAFPAEYKIQAAGREINLFYLLDDKRERIIQDHEEFAVPALGLQFTLPQILQEANQHPERFSPNVILRAAFQETILPNIAFIGGGAELAYWMELKEVFSELSIPYPVLILRNSFSLVTKKHIDTLRHQGLAIEHMFSSPAEAIKLITLREDGSNLLLPQEREALLEFYKALQQKAAAVDSTLAAHVSNLSAKALKLLDALEKKMIKAGKRKHSDTLSKLEYLNNAVFPGGSLQERKENFASYYSLFGRNFIETLIQYSLAWQQQYTVLVLS